MRSLKWVCPFFLVLAKVVEHTSVVEGTEQSGEDGAFIVFGGHEVVANLLTEAEADAAAKVAAEDEEPEEVGGQRVAATVPSNDKALSPSPNLPVERTQAANILTVDGTLGAYEPASREVIPLTIGQLVETKFTYSHTQHYPDKTESYPQNFFNFKPGERFKLVPGGNKVST